MHHLVKNNGHRVKRNCGSGFMESLRRHFSYDSYDSGATVSFVTTCSNPGLPPWIDSNNNFVCKYVSICLFHAVFMETINI